MANAASLDGPLLKLERAEYHLASLKAHRAAIAKHRYKFPFERDLRCPGYRPRLTFEESLPRELPLIVGDWAHNARASLDYLAWQLVIAAGNEPIHGPRGTTFPIPSKIGAPLNVSGKSVSGQPLKDAVAPAAIALIRRFQPHLGRLRDASNTDKHKHIVVHRKFVRDAEGTIVNGGKALGGIEVCGDLEEGAFIGTSSYWTSVQPGTYIDARGAVGVLIEVGIDKSTYDLFSFTEGTTKFIRDDLFPAFAGCF